jgi:uncharacterized RDD family membrane protein YckC
MTVSGPSDLYYQVAPAARETAMTSHTPGGDQPQDPATQPVPPASVWETARTRTVQAEVPGAPTLEFSDTPSRFVAYLIDTFFLGVVYVIVFAIAGGFGGGLTNDQNPMTVVANLLFVVLSLAYSVFFWTGGRRATPGQMVFKIQVGNAFDGRPLTAMQAFRRWLALGWFVSLFGIVPALAQLASWGLFAWEIALLVTTIRNPAKQGLHDRFANSAVVRPRGASANGLARACLISATILAVGTLLAIVALIFLGSQVSAILSGASNAS